MLDMRLNLDIDLAENYKSNSQKIRVLSESWVDRDIFCPNCGNLEINKYPNNKPVADFYCSNCNEDYELKSKQNNIGVKIIDGAYSTMIDRLKSNNNPNFFLLNYNHKNLSVLNFLVIPKHFFTPNIIERRKPLSTSARRAGWVGCNILLNHIPQSGKIYFIQNGIISPKNKVLKDWQKTLFLKDEKLAESKGWLLDVMMCLEKIDKKEFKLEEVYQFEKELLIKHPNNNHIRDKIRQQLQFLRDKGYIEFMGRGNYIIK